MNEDLKGAILQRDGESYAIVPKTALGLVTADTLENIARVIRKYNIPVTKITSGQRIALVGIKKEEIDRVWEDLGMEIGHATELCMHYVQACPGTTACKFGVQDSLGLGNRIDKEFYGYEFPAKLKIAVSGCPFSCGENYVKDFGVMGTKNGWTVIFGGNSGNHARIGDVLADGLTDDEVIVLAHKLFNYVKENAKKKERTARFVKRVGIDVVKKAIGLA